MQGIATNVVYKSNRFRPEATHVLIVDDDPDFLDLLTCEIEQIPGVTVDVAHDPEEAVRKLTLQDYRLIVSDWALDASDASKVLSSADDMIGENLKPAKIPVMFISGSEKVSQTQVLHDLKHFEPVSFLLKSCGPSMIGLLAEHILHRFSPLPELEPC
ncbi:MAG: response regulator [Bdellovibrionales bacterium]|nr:response regulator [Bdellovibrionales bacterium]